MFYTESLNLKSPGWNNKTFLGLQLADKLVPAGDFLWQRCKSSLDLPWTVKCHSHLVTLGHLSEWSRMVMVCSWWQSRGKISQDVEQEHVLILHRDTIKAHWVKKTWENQSPKQGWNVSPWPLQWLALISWQLLGSKCSSRTSLKTRWETERADEEKTGWVAVCWGEREECHSHPQMSAGWSGISFFGVTLRTKGGRPRPNPDVWREDGLHFSTHPTLCA